jgi:hypothetical protein
MPVSVLNLPKMAEIASVPGTHSGLPLSSTRHFARLLVTPADAKPPKRSLNGSDGAARRVFGPHSSGQSQTGDDQRRPGTTCGRFPRPPTSRAPAEPQRPSVICSFRLRLTPSFGTNYRLAVPDGTGFQVPCSTRALCHYPRGSGRFSWRAWRLGVRLFLI